MVDKHVPTLAVSKHLEVPSILVHIQNDVKILISDELFQIHHRAHKCHGNRRLIKQFESTQRVATQDDHRPGLSQFFKGFVPLAHLVEVDFTICKVDPDFEVVPRKRVLS